MRLAGIGLSKTNGIIYFGGALKHKQDDSILSKYNKYVPGNKLKLIDNFETESDSFKKTEDSKRNKNKLFPDDAKNIINRIGMGTATMAFILSVIGNSIPRLYQPLIIPGEPSSIIQSQEENGISDKENDKLLEFIRDNIDNISNDIDAEINTIPGNKYQVISEFYENLNPDTNSSKMNLKMAVDKGLLSEEDYDKMCKVLDKELFVTQIDLSNGKFDMINRILFGPVKDKELEKQFNEISKKYGVNIKYDNDLVLTYISEAEREEKEQASESKEEKVISFERLGEIVTALEQMKKLKQKLPEDIYITELFKEDDFGRNSAGVYCPKNPNAIALYIYSKSDSKNFKQTIYHESAHMADFHINPESEYGSERFPDIKINRQNQSIGDAETGITTARLINDYIGYYALTNNREFVAEITELITDEIIVKDEENQYIINPEKLKYSISGNSGYINGTDRLKNWDNSEEQRAELNVIMKIYDKFTDNSIVQARTI